MKGFSLRSSFISLLKPGIKYSSSDLMLLNLIDRTCRFAMSENGYDNKMNSIELHMNTNGGLIPSNHKII